MVEEITVTIKIPRRNNRKITTVNKKPAIIRDNLQGVKRIRVTKQIGNKN